MLDIYNLKVLDKREKKFQETLHEIGKRFWGNRSQIYFYRYELNQLIKKSIILLDSTRDLPVKKKKLERIESKFI